MKYATTIFKSGPTWVLMHLHGLNLILDCSESMKFNGKFDIATSIATVIVNTLTRQDYVNIICAHESHWNDIGKWYVYKTKVLSCQQDTMVKATLAFKRDLPCFGFEPRNI